MSEHREVPLMEKGKMSIPVRLVDEQTLLNVDYGEIAAPEKIGFAYNKPGDFDVSLSQGFPYMRARIDALPKSGFQNLVAFIQTTQSKYFAQVDDMMVAMNEKAVDIPPFLRDKQFPFYAFGYPAEIFSARYSDLRAFAKLSREINTFLVTFPNPGNGYTVSCLGAFSWGFVEWVEKGKHHVKLLPFKQLNFEYWNHALDLLERQFPTFRYLRYEHLATESEK
jgi:hypothetical protein